MHNNKWFTLVELIIVISILAVLTTVAFVSFKWYSQSSRDSVRVSDMKSIETALDLYILKNSKYPKPDDNVNITASGIILNYQWVAWDSVLWTIWVYWWWKDPSLDTFYTYLTNSYQNKYQLLWFIEDNSNVSIVNSTYANWYADKYITILGDDLWVLLNDIDNTPINLLENSVDIINSLSNYKLVNSNVEIIWDWNTIYKKIYNSRKDLFNNKDLAQYDNDLLGYWDMETLINSAWIDYIADLSWNANLWECVDYNTTVNCWGISWPIFSEWTVGKSLKFDWIDDFFRVSSLDNLNFPIIWSLNFSIKSPLSSQSQKSIFDNYNNSRDHIFIRSYNVWYSMQTTFQSGLLNKYVFNINSSPDESIYTNISISWDENRNAKFYLNWELITETTFPDSWTVTQQNFIFFWAPSWNFNLNGNLDEIRLYEKVLTDTEVKNIYNYQSN